MPMKKIILVLLLCIVFSPLKAQYVAGIGAYVSTATPVNSKEFKNQTDFVYEFSFKAFTQADKCFDIIGGVGKDYYNFTLLAEVHHPIFYPIDWYIGVGGNVGLWKQSHWNDGAKHDNTFAGLDGSLGLQCTIFPFSFNIGVRPVYTLYGGDQLYWLKQVGVRICFR